MVTVKMQAVKRLKCASHTTARFSSTLTSGNDWLVNLGTVSATSFISTITLVSEDKDVCPLSYEKRNNKYMKPPSLLLH